MPEVGYECSGHGPVFEIGHSEFFARGLHQLVDGGIMYMANAGEQVVFYLKIESAKQPGNGAASRREIGRGA